MSGLNLPSIDLENPLSELTRQRRAEWLESLQSLDRVKYPLLSFRLRNGHDPIPQSPIWMFQHSAVMKYSAIDFEKMKILLSDKTSEGVIWACLELSTKNGLDTIMRTRRTVKGKEKNCSTKPADAPDSNIKQEKIECDSLLQSTENQNLDDNILVSSERKHDFVKKEPQLDVNTTSPDMNLEIIPECEPPIKEPESHTSGPENSKPSLLVKIKREPSLSGELKSQETTDKTLVTLKRKSENSPSLKRKVFFSDKEMSREIIEISSEEECVDYRQTYEYPDSEHSKVDPSTSKDVTSLSSKKRKLEQSPEPCNLHTSLQRDLSGCSSGQNLKDSNLETECKQNLDPLEEDSDLREVINRRLREAKLQSIEKDQKKNKSVEQSDSFYIDHFKNRTGILIHAQPTELNDYCRKCEICGKKFKDMKQHVIMGHLTNSWWGTFGYSTCWLCHEYQFICEIRHCKGEFDPALHKEDFLFRINCFENYLKEELGCNTDHEIVNLVRSEGMCETSLSNFTQKETPFLEIIDSSKELTPKKIYNAANPTSFSELIHWRTILEILKYTEIRGLISGTTVPLKKIGLVETTCDLTEDYIYSPELGNIKKYVFHRNSSATETTSVVTDISVTKLTENQHIIDTLLNEKEIKVSLGIHPKDVQACNSTHLEVMMRYLSNPQVVALGNVGLDATIRTPMSNQVSVLKSFLQIAKKAKKPIRVFTKGCHSKTLKIMKECLEDDHKIHYTNVDLSMGEALEFLIHFTNSFIGISRKNLNQGSPGVEMAKRLSLSKLIPSSYAFTHVDDEGNRSFDMEQVVQMLGRIRMASRHSIAKQIRKNIITLYQF